MAWCHGGMVAWWEWNSRREWNSRCLDRIYEGSVSRVLAVIGEFEAIAVSEAYVSVIRYHPVNECRTRI